MFGVQRFRKRRLDEAYRSYVADSLQNIPQGKYLTQRWSDMTKGHEEIDVDATIEHVIARLEGR